MNSKKSSLLYSLTFSLTVFLISGDLLANSSEFAGGDGTQKNPYQITTCEMFEKIGASVDHLKAHYIIKNHIDCARALGWNDNKGFNPIGLTTPFTGSINGKRWSIENLSIVRSGESIGVFAQSNGFIRNLNFLNLTVFGSPDNSKKGVNAVGGVVGTLYGNAKMNRVSIFSGEITGTTIVGGLIGLVAESGASVSKSSSHASVRLTHHAGIQSEISVGGLIGKAAQTDCKPETSMGVDMSFTKGKIEAEIRSAKAPRLSFGGFIGSTGQGKCPLFLTDNFSQTDLEIKTNLKQVAKDQILIAGFVGQCTECYINYAYAAGRIDVRDKNVAFIDLDKKKLPFNIAGFTALATTSEAKHSYWDVDVSRQPYSAIGTPARLRKLRQVGFNSFLKGWNQKKWNLNPLYDYPNLLDR